MSIITEYDFNDSDLVETNSLDNSKEGLDEDSLGHLWGMGWMESETPHPGFGGTTNIYGGYASQCARCNIYGYDDLALVKCSKKV